MLLVEDLATDGRSKVNFVKAMREADGECDHCFVIFFYDIYPEGKKILADLGVTLHALTTWWDVLAVAKASGKFDAEDAGRGREVHERSGRLVEGAWRRGDGGGVTIPLVPRKRGTQSDAVLSRPWFPLRGNERIAGPARQLPLQARHRQIERRQKSRNVLPAEAAAARAWWRRRCAGRSADRASPAPCRSNCR